MIGDAVGAEQRHIAILKREGEAGWIDLRAHAEGMGEDVGAL
jgi:hypothetical protein